jgi:hypothetical protein
VTQFPIGKLASLVVAFSYAAAMAIHEHGVARSVAKGCVILLLALALIWFPDEIGSFTGAGSRGASIDAETPGSLVSFMGWLFLIGMPLLPFLVAFLTK